MKKIRVTLIVFVIGGLFLACAGSTTGTPTLDPQKTIWANLGQEPAFLSPTLNGDSSGANVINQTFEGLVREDEGLIYPGVASSWGVSADGLTVTFHLRNSVWSDGSPLTSFDFLYSFRLTINPLSENGNPWIWEETHINNVWNILYNGADPDTLGIEAPDEKTLIIHLSSPAPHLLSLLSQISFMPVQKDSVEAEGGANGAWAKNPELAVSNGPFVLKEYVSESHLVLEKNPSYWNADGVFLDNIVFSFIDSASLAYEKYHQGKLDVLLSVPEGQIPELLSTSSDLFQISQLETSFFLFNLQDSLFQNRHLRLALSLSIDRNEIVSLLARGDLPATSLIPHGFVDADGHDFSETSSYHFLSADDSGFLEAAACFSQAADELGLSPEELQTALASKTILINVSEDFEEIAELINQDWQENLGFQMTIQSFEWSDFTSHRISGGFGLCKAGWKADYQSPYGILEPFMSDNAQNYSGYSNELLDQILSEAELASDPSEYYQNLYQAYEILMEDMPLIPLYHSADLFFVKPSISGWERDSMGYLDFSRAVVSR